MNRFKIATIGIFGVVVASSVIWLLMPPWRSFGSIVYSSRDGLCSIDYPRDRTPVCLKTFYKDPSFSPDGQALTAVCTNTSWAGHVDSKIVVISKTGTHLGSLAGSNGFVRPIWSADGNFVYAINSSLHGTVGRWHWPSGEMTLLPVNNLETDCSTLNSLSISPTGDRAVLLCNFKLVYLATLHSDLISAEQKLNLQFSYVGIPKWIDENHLLAIARLNSGKPANLWRIDSKLSSAEIISTPELVLMDHVAVSPDSKSAVVTGSRLSPIKWQLWHVGMNNEYPTELTYGDEDTAPTWAR
jgi:hypothetical protein